MTPLEATLEILNTKLKSAVKLNATTLEKIPNNDEAMQEEIDAALDFEMKVQTRIKKTERLIVKHNKPGPVQVGAISKAQQY